MFNFCSDVMVLYSLLVFLISYLHYTTPILSQAESLVAGIIGGYKISVGNTTRRVGGFGCGTTSLSNPARRVVLPAVRVPPLELQKRPFVKGRSTAPA